MRSMIVLVALLLSSCGTTLMGTDVNLHYEDIYGCWVHTGSWVKTYYGDSTVTYDTTISEEWMLNPYTKEREYYWDTVITEHVSPPDSIQKRYREYWVFNQNQISGFLEEWFTDNNGVGVDYMFTSRYRGDNISIGYPNTHSDAYGKEVVNFAWNMISAGYGVYDNVVLSSMSLDRMSANGDTLWVKFCHSGDCYVDETMPSNTCYTGSAKFVRYDKLDSLAQTWLYY